MTGMIGKSHGGMSKTELMKRAPQEGQGKLFDMSYTWSDLSNEMVCDIDVILV